MSFSTYQEYKNSGIDWLGKIPANWSIGKFRHLFTESSEKIESEIHGEMLAVSGYRGIEIKEYADENQKRSEENLIGYRIVHEGQLVVNTMWLNYAGLGVSQLEGHVSPAYRSYWIDSKLHKPFIHHLMRSSLYVLGYTKYLTGVRPNSLQMSRDDLMNFPIVIPPILEQKLIAAFLDEETTKIDALVAEQESLIEILKEKRKALILNAVTKGFDSQVKFKESNIEWIGFIPDHWVIKPLKYIVKLDGGSGFPEDEQGDEDGEINFFKVGDLASGLVTSSNKVTLDTAIKLRAKVFKKGTIAFAKVGAALLLNRRVIMPIDGCVDNNMMVAIPIEGVCHQWLVRLLSVCDFGLLVNPGAVPSVNQDQVGNIKIPVPSLGEQEKISNKLEEEISKVDQLEKYVFQNIALLQEKRSVLISAAVTGQIDVSNHQHKEIA